MIKIKQIFPIKGYWLDRTVYRKTVYALGLLNKAF